MRDEYKKVVLRNANCTAYWTHTFLEDLEKVKDDECTLREMTRQWRMGMAAIDSTETKCNGQSLIRHLFVKYY